MLSIEYRHTYAIAPFDFSGVWREVKTTAHRACGKREVLYPLPREMAWVAKAGPSSIAPYTALRSVLWSVDESLTRERNHMTYLRSRLCSVIRLAKAAQHSPRDPGADPQIPVKRPADAPRARYAG